ncbi:hypothetical protein Tco_0002809 [Tanacetum coccineum]
MSILKSANKTSNENAIGNPVQLDERFSHDSNKFPVRKFDEDIEPHIDQLVFAEMQEQRLGDDNIKERALGRFNDIVGGSMETIPGEASILMPRRFRQFQAWNELKKIWQGNKKVKGFLMEKVRGGYSVAIAGYIAFVPFRPYVERRNLGSDKFTVESINSKRKKITVF